MTELEFGELSTRVTETLRESYPRSINSLTARILREFAIMLFEHKANYNHFYKAFKRHRFEAKRGMDFPPTAVDILKLILEDNPHLAQVADKETPSSSSVLVEFASSVRARGWNEALRELNDTPEDLAVIEAVPVFNRDKPYSCFPHRYAEYLTIFHTGDIIKAEQYYYDNANKANKSSALKALERAISHGNEKSRSFYNVFTDKTKTNGSIKRIVKNTKYDTNGFNRAKKNVAQEKKKIESCSI